MTTFLYYLQKYKNMNNMSLLQLSLLNHILKRIVGDRIQVVKREVCHGQNVMATIEPATYCFCFVCITICYYLRIFHDFLQMQVAIHEKNVLHNKVQSINHRVSVRVIKYFHTVQFSYLKSFELVLANYNTRLHSRGH